MDKFDERLKRVFTNDISVPRQCRDAMVNALFINTVKKGQLKKTGLKKALAIIGAGSVFATGVVFATNFNNVIEHFGLGKRN